MTGSKGRTPTNCMLAQGGTAIGTGLNAPPGFDRIFCEEVSSLSGLPDLHAQSEKIPRQLGPICNTLVEISGHLNVLAVSLVKIANDIRLLGSGPRCGSAEP